MQGQVPVGRCIPHYYRKDGISVVAEPKPVITAEGLIPVGDEYRARGGIPVEGVQAGKGPLNIGAGF